LKEQDVKSEVEIVDRIRENSALVRAAKKASRDQKAETEINHLLE
jgi:hypothetical protein